MAHIRQSRSIAVPGFTAKVITSDKRHSTAFPLPPRGARKERVLYRQPIGPNPLNHRDNFNKSASHHGILSSLFQVA